MRDFWNNIIEGMRFISPFHRKRLMIEKLSEEIQRNIDKLKSLKQKEDNVQDLIKMLELNLKECQKYLGRYSKKTPDIDDILKEDSLAIKRDWMEVGSFLNKAIKSHG